MSCWMTTGVRIFIEVTNLSFVNGDGEDLFFLELVRMILISFDYKQSLIFMESNL